MFELDETIDRSLKRSLTLLMIRSYISLDESATAQRKRTHIYEEEELTRYSQEIGVECTEAQLSEDESKISSRGIWWNISG